MADGSTSGSTGTRSSCCFSVTRSRPATERRGVHSSRSGSWNARTARSASTRPHTSAPRPRYCGRRLRASTGYAADVVVILVGGNDVTHRAKTSVSKRHLAQAVSSLQNRGTPVVVGTCPDLGA